MQLRLEVCHMICMNAASSIKKGGWGRYFNMVTVQNGNTWRVQTLSISALLYSSADLDSNVSARLQGPFLGSPSDPCKPGHGLRLAMQLLDIK